MSEQPLTSDQGTANLQGPSNTQGPQSARKTASTTESAVSQAAAGTEAALKIRDTELDSGESGRGHGPGHGPGPRPPRPGDTTGSGLGIGIILKRLLLFARLYWNKMIAAVVLAIVGVALTVIGPHYLEDITNEIAKGIGGSIDMDAVRRLVIISIVILVLSFVASYLQALLMVNATQRTSQNLRTGLNKKIDRMPLSYFDKTSHGDTLSRVTNDVDTLSQTLNSAVSSVISGVATLLGASLMMFVTEWRMALAGIAAAMVGFSIAVAIIHLLVLGLPFARRSTRLHSRPSRARH